MNKCTIVEYIWIDGQKPTPELRSKPMVLWDKTIKSLKGVPVWTMDGSSTCQANAKPSDRILKPVCMVNDPLRGSPHKLALCEVREINGKPNISNTRARLEMLEKKYRNQEPWFGIEQEYTLFDKFGKEPLYWKNWKNQKQGRFYCAVGSDVAFGGDLVEEHLMACVKAGIRIRGNNGEVMASQWEFQTDTLGPLEAADHIWLARWLLQRIGRKYKICVKFIPKPKKRWNGAGGHTNFSTKKMRGNGGLLHIEEACKKLKEFHKEHIKVYGHGNEKRLIGKHETADINKFLWGELDRGASVRIPLNPGKYPDHLEDRRPAANMDPYEVCAAILETVCGDGFRDSR